MTAADATLAGERELLAALLDAFEGSGLKTVRLPEADRRRDQVVRLLNEVVTDPDLLADYARLVEAECERRGHRVVLPLLVRVSPDIPERSILEGGFASVGDDVLADLALSPSGLRAVQQLVFADGSHRSLGDWFAETVLESTHVP